VSQNPCNDADLNTGGPPIGLRPWAREPPAWANWGARRELARVDPGVAPIAILAGVTVDPARPREQPPAPAPAPACRHS
jgi:hypothetical protein